ATGSFAVAYEASSTALWKAGSPLKSEWATHSCVALGASSTAFWKAGSDGKEKTAGSSVALWRAPPMSHWRPSLFGQFPAVAAFARMRVALLPSAFLRMRLQMKIVYRGNGSLD